MTDRQQIRRDAEAKIAPGKLTYGGEGTLARHCLALLTELEQTERVSREAANIAVAMSDLRVANLEARLANVPPLIEALKDAERFLYGLPASPTDASDLDNLERRFRAALAAWEQNGGGEQP